MDTSSESERAVIQKAHAVCNTHYDKWTETNFNAFYEQAPTCWIAHVGELTVDMHEEDFIGIVGAEVPKTYANRGDELCVWIHFLGIAPNARRQGNGTQFYYRLENEWFLAGATYLWGCESKRYPELLDFWLSLGFRRLETVPEGSPNYSYLEKSLCQNL